MSARVRFAPSPTGRLHVGNVRTALYNWLFARRNQGAFILRIEDTDADRSERRYERLLLEDLRWLGLDWDEGVEAGGDFGPYRQTDRADLYRRSAERLWAQDKAYYCFCSPERLEDDRRRQIESGRQPIYLGHCRSLSPDEARRRLNKGDKAVLRLRTQPADLSFEDLVFGPLNADSNAIGDYILLRSDGSPQYNFAVVVDDIEMKISHVVRGEGHIANTPKQLLLYSALGAAPPVFAHLSTILGKDGAKLSKRDGGASVSDFREQGFLPEALINYLALLGWTPPAGQEEILDSQQLIELFDLKKVHRSPAVFDSDKLEWVNRRHLSGLSADQLADLALPYLVRAGWVPTEPSPRIKEWLGELMNAVLKYLNRLEEATESCRVVFEFDPKQGLMQEDVEGSLAEEGAWEVIAALEEALAGGEASDSEGFKGIVDAVKTATGRKGRALFHPIRVALTLRTSGLELDKLVPLLERGKSLDLPVPVLGPRERVRAVLANRR